MPIYRFKCLWRATSMIMCVDAPNSEKAQKKVEAQLRRTEGGLHCQEIILLGKDDDRS